MEHKTLSVELRKDFGKGPARRLREVGKIPAVIYGAKGHSSIIVDAGEFSRKFKRISENTIITLDFGKEQREVLIKEYQENILKEIIEHVDFFEIEAGKLLKAKIPVVLTGNSPGVKEGGILIQKVFEVEVECLPKAIPEKISVSVDLLNVGHSIHLSELEEISGVTINLNPETTIVVVNHPKNEAVSAVAGEGEAAEETDVKEE